MIILVFLILFYNADSSCNMRGVNDENANIYYNGSPQPLNISGKKLILKYCPFLLPKQYQDGDDINMCCDENQLENFVSSLYLLEGIIPSCEICKYNIIFMTCNMICSPKQSEFSEVEYDSNNIITKILYNMKLSYINEFYDSCKDVKFQSTMKSILTLLCNTDGGDVCTPFNFINSLFSYSPVSVEVNIIFPNSTNYETLPSSLAMRCNESYNLHSLKISECSCNDCEASCFEQPEIITEDEILLNIFTLYQLIVLIIYGVVVLLILMIILCKPFLKKNKGGITVFEDSDPSIQLNELNKYDTPIINQKKNSFGKNFQVFIRDSLHAWAGFICGHVLIVSLISLGLMILLSCGIFYHFNVTSNPIEIWSPKNGEFRKYKDFFDTNFGPFYRTQQIIVKSRNISAKKIIPDINITFSSIYNLNVIKALFEIEYMIENSHLNYVDEKMEKVNISLKNICLKPLEPYRNYCAIFSISQYFNRNLNLILKSDEKEWIGHLLFCLNNPMAQQNEYFAYTSCLSKFSAPIEPHLVIGGYNRKMNEAQVFIITYITKNYKTESQNMPAFLWEKNLLYLLKKYENPYVEISFSTERSIEDEIDRQTQAEFKTVLVSYILMFLYVSVTLGKIFTTDIRRILVQQKLTVGFVGVLIVFLSVTASIGFFCYMGFPINMIILEVLPFLTLAVGVDNIFLMVNEIERLKVVYRYEKPITEIICEMMGNVGHGMIVSTVAQVTAFLIGSISTIPAVKIFSYFAATAIAINFIMQMTLLIGIIYLDSKREQSGRVSLFCCFKFSFLSLERDKNVLENIFKLLSKIVLNKTLKPIILLTFITIWAFSIFIIPSINIGLDQTEALSYDSYVLKYYQDVFKYLKTGPPVYFMIMPGFRYEQLDQRNKICSQPTCNKNSVTSLIHQYSKNSKTTRIATDVYSWVDAYSSWLRTSHDESCCMFVKRPANNGTFCSAYKYSLRNALCETCLSEKTNITNDMFGKYLPYFLADIPVKNCPSAGKSLYGNAVVLNKNYYEEVNFSQTPVYTSSFMAYHTPMRNGDDLIKSMVQSVKISKSLSNLLNHTVVSYSPFYIFYESYFTIWTETEISFGVSFGAVLVVNFILFGFCIRMSILMTFLIFIMISVNVGCMYILGINLNPISLVNLIMFIGINVEFLSHIGRAFVSHESNSRNKKASFSLIHTGSSVFSGIAMTKIIGILVLAFSKSNLFKIYYFQMFTCAIVVGTIHSLIILPILLSYLGPVNTPSRKFYFLTCCGSTES